MTVTRTCEWLPRYKTSLIHGWDLKYRQSNLSNKWSTSLTTTFALETCSACFVLGMCQQGCGGKSSGLRYCILDLLMQMEGHSMLVYLPRGRLLTARWRFKRKGRIGDLNLSLLWLPNGSPDLKVLHRWCRKEWLPAWGGAIEVSVVNLFVMSYHSCITDVLTCFSHMLIMSVIPIFSDVNSK